MSAEPPPDNGGSGYNPSDWPSGGGAGTTIDTAYLQANYLGFPSAQGAETLGDAVISGTLTTQDTSTFNDIANFNYDATFNGAVNLGENATITKTPDGTNLLSVVNVGYLKTIENVATEDGANIFTAINTFNANTVLSTATLSTTPSGTNSASVANVAYVQGNYAQLNNINRFTLGNTFIGSVLLSGGATLGATPTALDTTNVTNVDYVNTHTNTALVPYSTTLQMNSAISSATNGLAPINSPLFTGLPLLTTTPTAGISNTMAIANLAYINNQGFATTTSVNNQLANYTNTTGMNSAISSSISTALNTSPSLGGTPILQNTPNSGQTTAIANVEYVNNAISGGGSFAPATNAGAGNYAYQTGASGSPYSSILNQNQVGPLSTSTYPRLTADNYLNGLLSISQSDGTPFQLGLSFGGCYLISVNPNNGYANDIYIGTLTAGYGNSGNQINYYATQSGQYDIFTVATNEPHVYCYIKPNSTAYYNYTIRIIRWT